MVYVGYSMDAVQSTIVHVIHDVVMYFGDASLEYAKRESCNCNYISLHGVNDLYIYI